MLFVLVEFLVNDTHITLFPRELVSRKLVFNEISGMC